METTNESEETTTEQYTTSFYEVNKHFYTFENVLEHLVECFERVVSYVLI
jgi:hypothetical protein